MEKKTYFLPSVHGWPFGNTFHFKGTLDEYLGSNIFIFGNIKIDKNIGFCGGMCFTVLDRFYQGEYISNDLEPPTQGNELYGEIRQRLLDSVGMAGWRRIYEWQKSNDYKVGYMTILELDEIFASIDAGHPVQLLLLRTAGRKYSTLIDNHQVLAFKYKIDENQKVEIGIYDPNLPNNNNITISCYIAGWINASQNTGEPLRGFFKINYDQETPTLIINNVESDGWDIVEEGVTYLSGTRVRYGRFRIKFHWDCNFIPHFTLLRNNNTLRIDDLDTGMLVPAENIECKEAVGSYETEVFISKTLEDSYYQPVDLYFVCPEYYIIFPIEFVQPAIEAHPFIHSMYQRIYGVDIPLTMIADGNLADVEMVYPNNDLDSDVNLTETEKQDYWNRRIYVHGDIRAFGSGDLISSLGFSIIYKLGYVTAPINTEFKEEGLVGTIVHQGETYLTDPLNPTIKIEPQIFYSLSPLDRFQFYHGFSRANYDQDHLLTFDFKATDQCSQVTSGKLAICAKSLICIERVYHIYWNTDPEWESIRYLIYEDIYLILKEQLNPYLIGIAKNQTQEIRLYIEKFVEDLVNREIKQLETKTTVWQQISQSNIQIYKSMKKYLTRLMYMETNYSKAKVEVEKLKLELTTLTAQNTAKILSNELLEKIEVGKLIKIIQSKYNLKPISLQSKE